MRKLYILSCAASDCKLSVTWSFVLNRRTISKDKIAYHCKFRGLDTRTSALPRVYSIKRYKLFSFF